MNTVGIVLYSVGTSAIVAEWLLFIWFRLQLPAASSYRTHAVIYVGLSIMVIAEGARDVTRGFDWSTGSNILVGLVTIIGLGAMVWQTYRLNR